MNFIWLVIRTYFVRSYISALVIGVVGYCVIIWMCVGSVLRHNSIYCFVSKIYLNIPKSHQYCHSALTEFERKSMLCNFVNVIVRNVCQNNFLQGAETIEILCVLGYFNFLNNSFTYLVMSWWYFSYMLVHQVFVIIAENISTLGPEMRCLSLHMHIHS